MDCPGGSEGAPISFVTLQDTLGLPEDVLKCVLHSLVCGKHRILKHVTDRTAGTATSGSDAVADASAAAGEAADKKDKILSTDVYAFNDHFT